MVSADITQNKVVRQSQQDYSHEINTTKKLSLCLLWKYSEKNTEECSR